VLSTVELSTCVGPAMSPFPPISQPFAWAPGTLSSDMVAASPRALWGHGLSVPVVYERTSLGTHHSQDLLWPVPARRGLESDHLDPPIMVTKIENYISRGSSFMSQ